MTDSGGSFSRLGQAVPTALSVPQRLARIGHAPAISALMRSSVLGLFPAFLRREADRRRKALRTAGFRPLTREMLGRLDDQD